MGLENSSEGMSERKAQYATFLVAGRLYGIDVQKVQEVVKPMPMTKVPLADSCVRGLINLRGQVATAIGLRELFGLMENAPGEPMNVVCRCDGNLLSLLVDEIGDVIEVSQQQYESTPKTIDPSIKKYMAGVYKLKDSLISVIDVDTLFKEVNV